MFLVSVTLNKLTLPPLKKGSDSRKLWKSPVSARVKLHVREINYLSTYMLLHRLEWFCCSKGGIRWVLKAMSNCNSLVELVSFITFILFFWKLCSSPQNTENSQTSHRMEHLLPLCFNHDHENKGYLCHFFAAEQVNNHWSIQRPKCIISEMTDFALICWLDFDWTWF